MPDYKKEWLAKSEIDYFAPFISLWLACNSWYRSHYSELNTADRVLIDKIKTDFTGRNHLYIEFKKRIDNDDRNFKTNLELLHSALNRSNIQSERLKYPCSFNSLLVNYSLKEDAVNGYVNIIKNPQINADGEVSLRDSTSVIKLDQIYISSEIREVFAGIFELIYTVRNQLIHGHLNPDKDEHEVVKYCYMILSDIME